MASSVTESGELGAEEMHCGWLVKSPPLERTATTILKARWRRRWFVLEKATEGQYVLNYYTDENKRKLKGTIYLDECEQVDIGLTVENGRQRYEFMFDIKTPQRDYYLAADSYEDMSAWVRKVCAACGLSAAQDDDDAAADENDQDAGFTTADLAPFPSAASAKSRTVAAGNAEGNNIEISNPYIRISDCFTGGKHPMSDEFRVRQQRQELQQQQQLRLQQQVLPKSPTSPQQFNRSAFELSNYDMGDDSVFLSSTDEADSSLSPSAAALPLPPPPSRPPKPAHLAAMQSALAASAAGTGRADNYANSMDMAAVYEAEKEKNVIEESKNNQNPTNWPLPPPPRELKPGRSALGCGAATVDPKMLSSNASTQRQLQKHGLSQFSTMAPGRQPTTVTMPSPPRFAPPVERALKPKNTSGIFSSELDLRGNLSYRRSGNPPPPLFNIHTNRLTTTTTSMTLPRNYHSSEFSSDEAASIDEMAHIGGDSMGRHSDEEEQIYFYMPSLNSTEGGKYPTMIPAGHFEHPSISYIDLDLPPTAADNNDNNDVEESAASDAGTLRINRDSATAYKRIDFIKTEAFNRTRTNRVEKYNKELPTGI